MKLGDNRGMDILLVEDDDAIAASLISGLATSGMTVRRVSNGADAVAAEIPDVVLLDIGLPDFDGFEVCRRIRQKSQVPIIMLTAKGEEIDKVVGLEIGADDYVTKPFSIEELVARVESLQRRVASSALTRLRVDDLELDLLERKASRGGRRIELTAREFRLLEFLARHTGQVVTRAMLLQGVWDIHYDPQTNVVDVHVSRLRQAVDKDFEKPLIHTVRGVGYSLYP